MSDVHSPLCVMYLVGLDRRWLSPRNSPDLSRLLEAYPSTRVQTIPTNELASTIYTGTYPEHHGMWQVTLKRDVRNTRVDRLLDHVPDIVTTTWQCLRHVWDKAYELPGVPRRRRRRFDFHRFKYSRRLQNSEEYLMPGGVPSIFHVLGDRCSYRFAKSFRHLAEAVATLPKRGVTLSLLEVYAFDLFQHWNLDRPAAMRQKVMEVDGHVGKLERQCHEQGVRFMLLSDHGQEAVEHYINLQRLLRETSVPKADYTYYLEAVIARFWFRNDNARTRITRMLRSIEHTTLLTYADLHEYNIRFEDDRYGEVFLYSDHGHVFHPNDFVQPLANLFMALTEPTMRRRLFSGRLRGYHGHLPGHPAEEGFLVLADRGFRATAEEIELIDLATTILDLVGEPAPEHMTGRVAFESKRGMQSTTASRR